MMNVSVIVPVYNVEKYIHKCLSSLQEQTYQNFEVIVVNDGSPDNSQIIIDMFVKENNHFHSYIIENGGLGNARNYGMSKCIGEYVTFLDSDDYVDPYFLEKMMKKIEEDNSDIAVCDVYDVNENTGDKIEYKNKFENNPTSLLREPTILNNRVSAWGKIYRKSLFVENNFEYVSRAWYEDMRLTPKLFYKANSISYVSEPLIYYLIREGSIMNNKAIERNLEIIEAFEDIRNYFIQEKVYTKMEKEFTFLVLDHIMISAITRVATVNGTNTKETINVMEKYLTTYPNINNNPYINTLSKNRKIIYMLNSRKWYMLVKFLFKIKGKGLK